MPVAPSTRGHNSGHARKGQCQHSRKQRCCPARAPDRHVCRAEASNGTSTADPLLLRAARGDDVERTPVWLMRQAGRYMKEFRAYSDKYPFRQRSETPEIAIELSLQPYRAFRTDGVIFFSDILTPLPALGVEFDVIKGTGPVISGVSNDAPLPANVALSADPLTEQNWKNMKPMEDPEGSLPFIKETLGSLRSEIDSETTLLGFVGSPWTLAAYACEGKADRHCKKTKSIMVTNPAMLHGILDNMATALVQYVKYQIRSGAQVMQIFDSWAHHLSPAQFEEFSMPYGQRVINEVRAEYPNVPLIFHANGGVGKLAKMQGCTADVLGLDWNTDMAEAREAFPDRVLQGNVDPMVLFGSEEAIRDAVTKCCSDAGSRHILNVGHGVVQQTPEDNVKLFVELAKKFPVAV